MRVNLTRVTLECVILMHVIFVDAIFVHATQFYFRSSVWHFRVRHSLVNVNVTIVHFSYASYSHSWSQTLLPFPFTRAILVRIRTHCHSVLCVHARYFRSRSRVLFLFDPMWNLFSSRPQTLFFAPTPAIPVRAHERHSRLRPRALFLFTHNILVRSVH